MSTEEQTTEESNVETVTVHLVGAGALGSHIAEELAKKTAAVGIVIDKFVIHDNDTVEERNIYTQNYLPEHIGELKSEVTASRIKNYSSIAKCVAFNKRLDQFNIGEFIELPKSLKENILIIDAVDNIATRQLLHFHGIVCDRPVLHSGIDSLGQGQITWNFRDHDTFPLSPANLICLGLSEEKQENEPTESVSLPPCELTKLRGLILNTSIATANAACIYLGNDSTKDLFDLIEDLPSHNIMSSWESGTGFHKPLILNNSRIVHLAELGQQ